MERKRQPGYWRNYYLRVKQVNEVYVEHARRGVFVENIYRLYIRDRFYISRTTFYKYLTIPYTRELELIERSTLQQASDS